MPQVAPIRELQQPKLDLSDLDTVDDPYPQFRKIRNWGHCYVMAYVRYWQILLQKSWVSAVRSAGIGFWRGIEPLVTTVPVGSGVC